MAAHIGFGAAGLALAVGAMASRKGDRLHRGLGRIFVVCAGAVLATAAVAEILKPPKVWLLAATLSMAYQYLGSLRALALNTHGPDWKDAAAAIAALAVAAGLAGWFAVLGPAQLGVVGAAWGALGWLTMVAAYDLSRPLYLSLWRARLRPLDHGLKMTGAAFAMAAAGAGNLLKGLQPWSQLAPASLAPIVMIALAAAWLAQTRAGDQGAGARSA